MAAERMGATLPAVTVKLTIDRQDSGTGFDVSLRVATAPSAAPMKEVQGLVGQYQAAANALGASAASISSMAGSAMRGR